MVYAKKWIQVQVCYPEKMKISLKNVSLLEGSCLLDAISEIGLLKVKPEIILGGIRVGIYGKLKTLNTVLRNRDRVEIYKPLLLDPKDMRRRRVQKHKDTNK